MIGLFKLLFVLIIYTKAACSLVNWRYRPNSAFNALYRLRGGVNTNNTMVEDSDSSNIYSYSSDMSMNDKNNKLNLDVEDRDHGDLQINTNSYNDSESDAIAVENNDENEIKHEQDSSPTDQPTEQPTEPSSHNSKVNSNRRGSGGSMTDGDIFSLMDDLLPLPLDDDDNDGEEEIEMIESSSVIECESEDEGVVTTTTTVVEENDSTAEDEKDTNSIQLSASDVAELEKLEEEIKLSERKEQQLQMETASTSTTSSTDIKNVDSDTNMKGIEKEIVKQKVSVLKPALRNRIRNRHAVRAAVQASGISRNWVERLQLSGEDRGPLKTPAAMPDWKEQLDAMGGENELQKVLKLFQVYRFKGLGLTFQKPLSKWRSVGFGLRIPITAHFPQYDRLVALPRFSMSLVGYWPVDFKLGCSISFPVTQALYAITKTLHAFKLTSSDVVDKIRDIKPSDSIKRVGITISFYYNIKRGIRYSIGPYGYYLPGMRIRKKILPVLLTFPAFFAIFFHSILPFIFSHIGVAEDRIDRQNDELQIQGEVREEDISNVIETESVDRKEKKKRKKKSSLDNSSNNSIFLEEYRKQIRNWVKTKSGGFASNLSFTKKSSQPPSMGSTLQFNLSPFFINNKDSISS